MRAGAAAGDLVTRLKRLDTCAVSDALDKLKLTGVVIGLPQLSSSRRIAGRVLTVKLGVGDAAFRSCAAQRHDGDYVGAARGHYRGRAAKRRARGGMGRDSGARREAARCSAA